MTIYKPLRQDPVTQEYYYNGKWYDSYPFDEIEKDEAALDEYWNREIDRKRDREGKHGI